MGLPIERALLVEEERCKCGSAKRRPDCTTRFALPPLEVVSLADARIACLARTSTHRNPVLEPSTAARDGAALSFPSFHQGHAPAMEQARGQWRFLRDFANQ